MRQIAVPDGTHGVHLRQWEWDAALQLLAVGLHYAAQDIIYCGYTHVREARMTRNQPNKTRSVYLPRGGKLNSTCR